MNILTNAIDALEDRLKPHHKPEASYTPTITIQTELLSNNQVEIAISDNGLGIPETIQRRLFDPFFTTKPIGKGTGMGLSISYQIITEKHHGKLECQSHPNQGSQFTITVPRFQSETANPPS